MTGERMSSAMRKGLIGLGVVVLAGGGVTAALYSKSNSGKDKDFKTVPVTRGPVVEKALAVGAIRPKHEITVKSKISGIVRTSYREVGDKVKAGDPLFEIIPDPTPMELTEARREVEIAKNIHDQAQKKFDRSKALKDQGILSSQDWEVADKDIQDATIRLSLATEKLALIEKGRVKTERLAVEAIIRAPTAGTVLELLVNEGDPVVPLTSYQAGTPSRHSRTWRSSCSRAPWTRSTWASSTRACPRGSRSAPSPTRRWTAGSPRSP